MVMVGQLTSEQGRGQHGRGQDQPARWTKPLGGEKSAEGTRTSEHVCFEVMEGDTEQGGEEVD